MINAQFKVEGEKKNSKNCLSLKAQLISIVKVKVTSFQTLWDMY